MSRLHGQIRYVAPYFRTALLCGEHDCGDEAAARALHRLSPLSHRPFVELTPADAEFRFGQHSPQAATASEGMIYLPQPERLSSFAQATLLRILRERGSQAPRIVAFAENGIRSLVGMGTFSPELADSLAALRIPLPPLRERPEDIPDLLTAMLREQAGNLGIPPPQLAPDLLESSARESWPGNFNQLRSAARALLDLSSSHPLHAGDLQTVLNAIPALAVRERRTIRLVTLDRIIQEHLHAVLFACKGNKLRAAEILGISRSTLYRMLDNQDKPATDAEPLEPSPIFAPMRIAS
jgi:DNA-binding NtrC family response regulator